ncbi:MAG: flavodoxin family protein [Candidatus Brocadiia bacterium]
MTRVLCLSCSPRKGGNTDFCARVVAEELRTRPALEVEVARLKDYDIKHCLGCRKCMELKDCVIRDDDFHELWRRIMAANIIIQFSPVYWLGPPGRHKDLIDRSHAYFACGRVLAGKTGHTVSVAGDSGFEPHEACVESWLRWYGVNVQGHLRVIAREAGAAEASPSIVAELRRFAREIAP